VGNQPRKKPLRLPYRAPLAADTLLSFLGARAIPGVEEVRDRTYRRSVVLPGGPAIVAMTLEGDDVSLDVSPYAVSELGDVAQRARRAFDLDADPGVIDAVLIRDPRLASLVRRTPGIRVPDTFDAFELVVRAIFGQQVSVAAARTSLGGFAARFGTKLDHPTNGVTHLFPGADQVADIPPGSLEMPRGRAEAIVRVAQLVATGELDLSEGAPTEQAIDLLGTVRGIGPWTLEYVAMRGFRDPDAFMSGDLGVRRGFEALGLPTTHSAILERSERWRPFRSYAVMHLWHTHACV
jgi:AraC family transcriptional regulator of adaptative response / DNA-3-methyladenine glycosylase II